MVRLMTFGRYIGLPHGNNALTQLVVSLGGKKRLVKADDQYAHVTFRDKGVELGFTARSWLGDTRPGKLSDFILTHVHVYRKGQDGYRQFEGRLPSGIKFGMSRDKVRDALGSPVASSDGAMVGGVVLEPWDKFEAGNVVVGIGYSEDGTVCNVELTKPEYWPAE